VVMELWGQCTSRYQGIGIREIGGTGTSAERDPAHTWVYYNPTDSDIGAKPSATGGTVIVDPVPHTQTKSVLKNFTIPAGQVSYVKIMTPTGQSQKMVVYSADGTNLHGECILRTYNDGNPSSGRCQVLALGGNPRRWFGKSNEQYIEFDWTAESANKAFRFGITELSGGDSANFELVSTLPSGTVEITPTGMTPASHTHGNIANGGTLTDTAAAAAGNDYVVIRDADNAKIQTSTIKGTDVADAVSKKHSHSTLTLSTTAQSYDGSHTLALPSTDPYTSARTPASHTHGNIQNGGTLQTTDVTIANGDKLVITDSSDSNKVARASLSFDGSTFGTLLSKKGTFEYPYDEYLAWGGRDRTGDFGVIDAALVTELGANRLAGGKAAGITIEYTRDGGTTWTDYGASDLTKRNIFTNKASSISLGKCDSTNKATTEENYANYKTRVIINCSPFGIYNEFRKFVFYVSTNGSNQCYMVMSGVAQAATSDVWTTIGEMQLSGWSGFNVYNKTLKIGLSSYATYKKICFTFEARAKGSTNYNGMSIFSIWGYGGVGWTTPSTLASSGTVYSVNGNLEVTFPAKVTATEFAGPLTGNATSATKLATARKLAVSLSNTSTDTTFDGSADVTNIKVSGQLADANIASAATWNAKQDAITYMTTTQENELISELGDL